MTYDGSEILDDDADMETFLDVEIVEIFPLENNRGVNRLPQDLCKLSVMTAGNRSVFIPLPCCTFSV